jgi:Uma2 family endonuclease
MALAETTTQTKTLMTAEELWQLVERNPQSYELVEGELIEMTPPGGIHGKTTVRLVVLLQNFVSSNQLGEVLVETGFLLTAQPDTVRSPDVSFIAAKKIPAEGLPDGYISGAPDLAIEVVSPNDTASMIQDKVQDYLIHGTQLVWVVYPQQRMITVYHPDGTARTLGEAETLSGEAVVPGFSCQVSEIFD